MIALGSNVHIFARPHRREELAQPAPAPIFLVAKGAPPEFRVRMGNASPALDVKDAYQYITHHWGWAPG